jgi:nucleoside-diphosphate-sugar epimerase
MEFWKQKPDKNKIFKHEIKPQFISILGSGWLGLPLAEYLVKQSYQVKASTRSDHRIAEIETVAACPFVIDIDQLRDNIQNFLDSEILIINITSKNQISYRNLIAEVAKSPVSKVLLVSSTSVYKFTNNIVTESNESEDEGHPLCQIERLFQSCYQFKTTIVRFAGLFGYSRHPGRFFSNSNIVPQADSPVNLIHRDDCINIVAKIIELAAWGEILNACASTHPSKRAFYSYARNDLSLFPPEFSCDDDSIYKEVSNEKLKRLLNYNFVHDDLLKVEF